MSELRRWADPAVEANQGDELLLAGSEALAALGALWAGDPVAAAPLLDSATARLDGSPTTASDSAPRSRSTSGSRSSCRSGSPTPP